MLALLGGLTLYGSLVAVVNHLHLVTMAESGTVDTGTSGKHSKGGNDPNRNPKKKKT